MTDPIPNRLEFNAQTAAAVAVRDWIDNSAPSDPLEPRPALIGCTPAMVSQIACDAYRDHIAEHGETFTFEEVRITLTAFASWLLKDGALGNAAVELADKFIAETTADDEPPAVLRVVDGKPR